MSTVQLSDEQVNAFLDRLKPIPPKKHKQKLYKTAIVWPNSLGWDVDDFEVMQIAGGRLLVRSDFTCAIVVSTKDPIEAVALTRKFGFLVEQLEDMNRSEANALFRKNVL